MNITPEQLAQMPPEWWRSVMNAGLIGKIDLSVYADKAAAELAALLNQVPPAEAETSLTDHPDPGYMEMDMEREKLRRARLRELADEVKDLLRVRDQYINGIHQDHHAADRLIPTVRRLVDTVLSPPSLAVPAAEAGEGEARQERIATKVDAEIIRKFQEQTAFISRLRELAGEARKHQYEAFEYGRRTNAIINTILSPPSPAANPQTDPYTHGTQVVIRDCTIMGSDGAETVVSGKDAAKPQPGGEDNLKAARKIVEQKIREYDHGGDRPHSPPAWLLELRLHLSSSGGEDNLGAKRARELLSKMHTMFNAFYRDRHNPNFDYTEGSCDVLDKLMQEVHRLFPGVTAEAGKWLRKAGK